MGAPARLAWGFRGESPALAQGLACFGNERGEKGWSAECGFKGRLGWGWLAGEYENDAARKQAGKRYVVNNSAICSGIGSRCESPCACRLRHCSLRFAVQYALLLGPLLFSRFCPLFSDICPCCKARPLQCKKARSATSLALACAGLLWLAAQLQTGISSLSPPAQKEIQLADSQARSENSSITTL